MAQSEKPYLYLVLMLVVVYAYSVVARMLYGPLGLTEELDIYVFNKWLLVLLLGCVVFGLRLRRAAGLVPGANWRTLPLYRPMALMAGLVWAGADGLPSAEVLTKATIFCAAVGISEEVMFRGLVFHWFRDRSVRTVIVISATSFAFIHLAVGLSSTLPVEAIVGQAFLAFALGLIFAAARARDVSVLIPILVHAGLDIAVIAAQGSVSETLDSEAANASGLVVIATIVLAWGLWLLWRSGDAERRTYSDDQPRDTHATRA